MKKKILIAASGSISRKVLSRNIAKVPIDWLDFFVLFQDKNEVVASTALEKNPGSKPIKLKTRSDIKKALKLIDHLILFWDGEDLTDVLFEARVQDIPTKVIPVQVTRVVNKKTTDKYDIYIGRGSPWGNPYAISHGEGPDRAEVIEKYKEYFYEKIESDSAFKKGILGMKGMRLACFCKPEACHGDIIADYIDNLSED